MTPSLLRIPPFPGAAGRPLALPCPARRAVSEGEAVALIAEMRRLRVGGTYWGAQPDLEAGSTVLACAGPARSAAAMQAASRDRSGIVFWTNRAHTRGRAAGAGTLEGCCDPWHLFGQCDEVWADADDELALLASIAGRRVSLFGTGRYAALAEGDAALAAHVSEHLIAPFDYRDPFGRGSISACAAARQLGEWRALIDANRPLRAILGVARWKRPALAPMMWGGGRRVPFVGSATASGKLDKAGAVAVWKARTPPPVVAKLEREQAALVEIEDGFIRSVGLGANCVPPLSMVADPAGAHYDPSRESGLERLISRGDFGGELLARATALRRTIVASSISKYGIGGSADRHPGRASASILVVGQVEDDRSILLGAPGIGNLTLLQRVRAQAPDGHIIYRPHPDVDSGHRKGGLSDREVLLHANDIARGIPITQLIAACDHVHVLTSLAGFEALMRDKPVTTHGVPFYAGWGLTTDLGPVPARRQARRTIDELVAATLILYPRYLDPVTRLPCPPEVLIERLLAGATMQNSGLVALRRLQGLVARTIRGVERSA